MYQPHEIRVMAEKAELDAKIISLRNLLVSESLSHLTMQEQDLLQVQIGYMRDYSRILGERIALFIDL